MPSEASMLDEKLFNAIFGQALRALNEDVRVWEIRHHLEHVVAVHSLGGICMLIIIKLVIHVDTAHFTTHDSCVIKLDWILTINNKLLVLRAD